MVTPSSHALQELDNDDLTMVDCTNVLRGGWVEPGECRGSVNKEFPEEFRRKTLEQIFDAARRGNKAAQRARKFLTDLRFKK